MKRKSPASTRVLRAGLAVVFFGVVPLVIGCQAILDFDRTPLQPEVEASVRETGATVPDAGRDTGSSGDDDDDDDDKPDASDGGSDADADAGDAN